MDRARELVNPAYSLTAMYPDGKTLGSRNLYIFLQEWYCISPEIPISIFNGFMVGLCAVSSCLMYIIRLIESAREKARFAKEVKERLRQIPQSCLNGVEALPVELWSQVVGFLVDPYLQHKELQCDGLHTVLDLRLVCREYRNVLPTTFKS